MQKMTLGLLVYTATVRAVHGECVERPRLRLDEVELRSESTKLRARECVRDGRNGSKIFFQHVRKAGGTLFRHWLAVYRCNMTRISARSVKVDYMRGSVDVAIQEQDAFNPAILCLAPHYLYITCLRDPILRIWSAYWFEGRWPLHDRQRSPSTAIPFESWFEAELNRSSKRADLAASIYHNHGAFPKRQRLWSEVSNYYVQIFSGVAASPVTANHFAIALATLNNFDAVLILERIATPPALARASASLRRLLFFVDDTRHITCPKLQLFGHHLNKGSSKNDAVLSNTQRQMVQNHNTWDQRLYRHAYELHDKWQLDLNAVPASRHSSSSASSCAAHPRLLYNKQAIHSAPNHPHHLNDKYNHFAGFESSDRYCQHINLKLPKSRLFCGNHQQQAPKGKQRRRANR